MQPVDEVSLIEERRKRREAIKAKHKDQATPVTSESLVRENPLASPKLNMEVMREDSKARGRFWECLFESLLMATLDSPQKSPPPTTKDTSGQDSPTDFVVLKDTDLANNNIVESGSAQEDEPSAADYDPTMDMQEDKARHEQHQRKDEVPSGVYDETTNTDQKVLLPESMRQSQNESKEDGLDMFAEADEFDMFAEGPAVSQKPEREAAKAVPIPQAKALDMSMLDDWDDPDGYYKVILGELLNDRYHVQSNLGKGMFSGVVRAKDQKSKSLVAIKLIRNNETM